MCKQAHCTARHDASRVPVGQGAPTVHPADNEKTPGPSTHAPLVNTQYDNAWAEMQTPPAAGRMSREDPSKIKLPAGTVNVDTPLGPTPHTSNPHHTQLPQNNRNIKQCFLMQCHLVPSPIRMQRNIRYVPGTLAVTTVGVQHGCRFLRHFTSMNRHASVQTVHVCSSSSNGGVHGTALHIRPWSAWWEVHAATNPAARCVADDRGSCNPASPRWERGGCPHRLHCRLIQGSRHA